MIGEDQPNVDGPPHSRRLAVGASVSIHIVVGALAIWLSTLPRSFAAPEQAQSPPRHDLIWIASPGPGGGGGGGGDQTTVAAPARRVGPDRLTVPTTRPEPKPMRTPKEPPPIAPLAVPAQPVASAIEVVPGVMSPVRQPRQRKVQVLEGAPEAAVALAAGKGRARDSVPASEAERGRGLPARQRCVDAETGSRGDARLHGRCPARQDPGHCCGRMAYSQMGPSATSRLSNRSTRSTAWMRKRSKPPSSGASSRDVVSANRCPCSYKSSCHSHFVSIHDQTSRNSLSHRSCCLHPHVDPHEPPRAESQRLLCEGA